MFQLHRSVVCVTLLTTFVAGCVPPQETDTPVEEPVPVDDNGIPWAPGEEPESHEHTTREVSEGPKEREEPPPEYFKDDGIQQTGGSGDSSRCSGRATPALRAAVDARAKETHACYDKVPEDKAGAQGDLRISMKIDKKGQVAQVAVQSDTLGIPEVTRCVEDVLREPFTDARPAGGCAVFVLPIHLESERVESPPEESAKVSEEES